MDLIKEGNECVAKVNANLTVALGVSVQGKGIERLRHSRKLYSKDDVQAVFQLLETGNVIVQATEWNHFLSLVAKEFGERFMKQSGLYSLEITDACDD